MDHSNRNTLILFKVFLQIPWRKGGKKDELKKKKEKLGMLTAASSKKQMLQSRIMLRAQFLCHWLQWDEFLSIQVSHK